MVLVRPNLFCTDQICFGHIEGQGINLRYVVEKNKVSFKLGFGQKLMIFVTWGALIVLTEKDNFRKKCKVMSSNSSRLEAHEGFF